MPFCSWEDFDRSFHKQLHSSLREEPVHSCKQRKGDQSWWKGRLRGGKRKKSAERKAEKDVEEKMAAQRRVTDEGRTAPKYCMALEKARSTEPSDPESDGTLIPTFSESLCD